MSTNARKVNAMALGTEVLVEMFFGATGTEAETFKNMLSQKLQSLATTMKSDFGTRDHEELSKLLDAAKANNAKKNEGGESKAMGVVFTHENDEARDMQMPLFHSSGGAEYNKEGAFEHIALQQQNILNTKNLEESFFFLSPGVTEVPYATTMADGSSNQKRTPIVSSPRKMAGGSYRSNRISTNSHTRRYGKPASSAGAESSRRCRHRRR